MNDAAARAALLLSNRSRSAAFLCYHSIAAGGPPFLSLPPELFERQLALLSRTGWRTGTSSELVAALTHRPDTPTAFLTFDDGYIDNHAAALPLLQAYGMTAMVFVLPPLLAAGGALAWPEVRERRELHPGVMRSMTWEMVDDMAAAGIEIGSHGLTHAHLDRIGPEQLRDELLDARRAIADRVGRCEVLAYPFGDWSPAVAQAAADAGYRFAFTMPRGGQLRGGPWSIPRIPVDHRDDERRFARKLSVAGRTVVLSPARAAARRLRGIAGG